MSITSVKTKELLKEIDKVKVLVDNEIAIENLTKFAGVRHYQIVTGDDGDDFYAIAERILRGELNCLQESGKLDNLCIMKPYSFVLVDEDRETVAELLLVDNEDTLLLNDELLKGLDEELDAFLKDLLEK